ncbi:MAG TPA: globin domain-containing protein, partial [Humisphaera sp.]
MKFTTHPLAGQSVAKAFPKADRDLPLVRRLATSLAVMTQHGDGLARTFYGLLFDRHPAVRLMFPADMANQRAKLLQTLQWVVDHLDQPATVLPEIAALGRRHADYGTKAEHYPVVVDLLLEAMAATAGPAWSDELRADWRSAMALLSARMIEAARAGGPPQPTPTPAAGG